MGKGMNQSHIWVIGNAVQDMTIDIDLERLQHEYPNIYDWIRIDQNPQLKKGICILTSLGSKSFKIKIQLQNEEPNDKSFYTLCAGRKYTLKTSIKAFDGRLSNGPKTVFVPCEDLSWGGGGINLVKFLRALAPNDKQVPITYTDIAMSQTLPKALRGFKEVLDKLPRDIDIFSIDSDDVESEMERLYLEKPDVAEDIAAKSAKIAANYTPDDSLKVFISSLPAEFAMYRPKNARFRRNLVISQIHNSNSKFGDKIICRGPKIPRLNCKISDIKNQIYKRIGNIGLAVLDSIKDMTLSKAAYNICEDVYEKKSDFAVILAVTDSKEAMDFAEWVAERRHKQRQKSNCGPPCILIMNENEAFALANRIRRGGDTEPIPFMARSTDYPDMYAFAGVINILSRHFMHTNQRGRIYVTLGSRGCLGFDNLDKHIVYVANYQMQDGQIFDTNGCGDAFASAITLLEWASRYIDEDIGRKSTFENDRNAKEMEYFMAVACATAYSKATNPRGRVDSTVVQYLLDQIHLSSYVHEAVAHYIDNEKNVGNRIDKRRLIVPEDASQKKITPSLAKILSGVQEPGPESSKQSTSKRKKIPRKQAAKKTKAIRKKKSTIRKSSITYKKGEEKTKSREEKTRRHNRLKATKEK